MLMISETISQRLYAVRMTRGLLQRDVAKQAFIARKTYGAYEQGVRTPNYDILATLAKVLRVSPQYLTGWTNKYNDWGKKWLN